MASPYASQHQRAIKYLEEAELKLSQKIYDRAIYYANMSLNYGDYAESYLFRGIALFRSQDYHKAKKDLDLAITKLDTLFSQG